MSKQTAVEWFNDEIIIHLNFDQRLYLKDIFKQAKEMEKHQIRQAYNDGKAAVIHIEQNMSLEEYYHKTFKNETK